MIHEIIINIIAYEHKGVLRTHKLMCVLFYASDGGCHVLVYEDFII